jgi:hypothetical protein
LKPNKFNLQVETLEKETPELDEGGNGAEQNILANMGDK